ncbi:MAG: hypothetical protein V6Z81_02980 [Parvularculales bacterium]
MHYNPRSITLSLFVLIVLIHAVRAFTSIDRNLIGGDAVCIFHEPSVFVVGGDITTLIIQV